MFELKLWQYRVFQEVDYWTKVAITTLRAFPPDISKETVRTRRSSRNAHRWEGGGWGIQQQNEAGCVATDPNVDSKKCVLMKNCSTLLTNLCLTLGGIAQYTYPPFNLTHISGVETLFSLMFFFFAALIHPTTSFKFRIMSIYVVTRALSLETAPPCVRATALHPHIHCFESHY